MIYLYVFQIFVLLVSVAAKTNIKSPGISGRRFHSGTKDGKLRNSDWQIVGGYKANATDFPYMASVLYYLGEKMFGYCGGTLIRPNHVLTAAHCIVREVDGNKKVISKDKLEIRVGSDSPFIGGEAFPVDCVSVHEIYLGHQKYEMEADIAVLAIGGGFQFSQTVSPMNLPKSQDGKFLNNLQAKGAECVVAGWGLLSYPGNMSDTLMAVKVNLIKTSYCRQILEEDGKNISDEVHVCTNTEGKAPCTGDSGGGLICGTGDSAYVWGVTSFSMKCAEKDLPAIYARVDTYYDFIEKALKGTTLITDTIHDTINDTITDAIKDTDNAAFTLYSTLSTNVITVGFVLSLNFECFLKQ